MCYALSSNAALKAAASPVTGVRGLQLRRRTRGDVDGNEGDCKKRARVDGAAATRFQVWPPRRRPRRPLSVRTRTAPATGGLSAARAPRRFPRDSSPADPGA